MDARWTPPAGPILLALVLGCTGCAQFGAGAPALLPPGSGLVIPEVVLPKVTRGEIVPTVSKASIVRQPVGATDLPASAQFDYHALTASECQCLAARNSALGRVLDSKAADCQAHDCEDGGSDPTPRVLGAAMSEAAREARNRAASDALELYYRLAESEARRDIIRRSLAEIGKLLADEETLRLGGTRTGTEFETLRAERAVQESAADDLELAIDRLNGAIKLQLRLAPRGADWRVWPADSWEVVDDRGNIPAAVALGLASRGDLRMLTLLTRQSTPGSLAAAKLVLTSTNALLGADCESPGHPLFVLIHALMGRDPNEDDYASIARQIDAFRDDRERTVAEEIRQAAVTVQVRLRQVAVAQDRLGGTEARVRDETEREARGIGSSTAVANARLKLLTAEANRVEAVMAWKIARVKLKEAQGLLADECGPGFPLR